MLKENLKTLFYLNYLENNAIRIQTDNKYTHIQILRRGIVKNFYISLTKINNCRLVGKVIGGLGVDRDIFLFAIMCTDKIERVIRVIVREDNIKKVKVLSIPKETTHIDSLMGGEYFWRN